MTTKTFQNTTKTFKFSYPTCTNEELLFKLEVPVEIPHEGSTRELVQRVINMFHIPVYLEDELNMKLAEFVAIETKSYHDERDERLLDQLKEGTLDVDGIVKNWEKLFKDNVVEFAEQRGTSDEEVLAAAYHQLVHSPALETILQVENSYAKTVMEMVKNRDDDIKKLTDSQTEEMEEKVRLVNTLTTEEEVNELAASHFEQRALLEARWGSRLDALRAAQRSHHRGWLMTTLAHYHASEQLHTPSNSPLATFSPAPALGAGAPTEPGPPPPPTERPRLEESFTIHLGSQLKQTHNIRLRAMDVMDLCTLDDVDNPVEAPRRLQTRLAVYSHEVLACVVLSSARAGDEVARVALMSAEHHFDDVTAQLQRIEEAVKEPLEKRNAERLNQQSTSTNAHAPPPPPPRAARARRELSVGDVYVTRHTNLPETHVVFHLVVDDSLRSGDITSRHPAILGLRNILKACCANDVTALSLPLLLTDDRTEELPVWWWSRRAELVLKCVKGFCLETAGWGGCELRTLSALLPPHTPAGLFATLAAQVPAIFRLNNPVKGKVKK